MTTEIIETEKPQAPTPMTIISQMVSSGQMDIATVQGLLDIQRELEKSEAVKSYNHDFALMRSEMPVFKREKKSFTTKYTPLEDIMKLAQPVMSKYGFSASFATEQQDQRSVKVVCEIMHRDGHSKSTSIIVPVEVVTKGMNNMQALGSAITYGKRYSLSGLLNIVTAEDDDNNGFSQSARSSKPKITDMEGAKKALASGKVNMDYIYKTYDVSPQEAVELSKVEVTK